MVHSDKRARELVVGALALSIRYNSYKYDIKSRQQAIEELWGSSEDDAYIDGRCYRDWDGPYGYIDYDDYLELKEKFPSYAEYLELIPVLSEVINGIPEGIEL
jgi:hypothetical protein